MNKREARGIVKRTLSLMFNEEGLLFGDVYDSAVGLDEDGELPEHLRPHENLLDECLIEFMEELSEA